MIVLVFLAAIVAANLSVAAFGPAAVIANAFLFIGLDLSARDRLHEQWRGDGLAWKMALLIAAGGALSWALNRGAGQIALASSIAFAGGASADALLYHLLRHSGWAKRANGSNVAGAVVDSLLFPTLAFGAWMPAVVVGQIAAKVAGGALWAWILRPADEGHEVARATWRGGS